MPQSLSKNYVHIVFSTKHRMPLIQAGIKKRLYEYIEGMSRKFESPTERINGTEDHVHILVNLSRKMSIMVYVQKIKANSSGWVKKTFGEAYNNFYWQDGYGAFSVDPRKMKDLIDYIDNQDSHHLKYDFKTEYRMILEEFEVEYDEKYVWD